MWDAERSAIVRELPDHNGAVAAVSWHTASAYQLASVGAEDATLRLWDVRAHPAQVQLRRAAQRRSYRCVEYAPDGETLACGGDAGVVVVYDLRAGGDSQQQNGLLQMASSSSVGGIVRAHF